jgi:hypothetical protein
MEGGKSDIQDFRLNFHRAIDTLKSRFPDVPIDVFETAIELPRSLMQSPIRKCMVTVEPANPKKSVSEKKPLLGAWARCQAREQRLTQVPSIVRSTGQFDVPQVRFRQSINFIWNDVLRHDCQQIPALTMRCRFFLKS